MTASTPPPDPDGEVVEVSDAIQRRPRATPDPGEPLLDRATTFWLWMFGLAVVVAVAAIVVGVSIG